VNDHKVFELGNVVLQEGATLREAKLAYKTFGSLNDDKSNAIVYPTWYSGRHWENEWLIGGGMALDPSEYFIIIPNMLGNGLSSSPSNTPPALRQVPLSQHHRLRQRGCPTPARCRALRHREARTRHRLVDGRRVDLPVGCQPPGDGGEDSTLLWISQDQPSQHRVSRRSQGRAHGG